MVLVNASQGPDSFDDEYESFELKRRDDGDDLDDDDLDDVDDDGENDEEDDDLDDDDLDDDDDDDDDLDDAEDEDIDLVIAAYTEEGHRTAVGLAKDLANDLEELIRQLRRLPGDAGAAGFVSLGQEMFVITRVRGEHVQVLLSDGSMAGEWPIARDVVDLLGLPELPGEDDVDPIGDLTILEDSGISEFDMVQYCEDDDADTDELVLRIAAGLGLGDAFREILSAEFGD